MKNCLIITGNEVNHNFFINSLNRECNNYKFTFIKVASGMNDFEYFYPTFSKEILKSQKKAIVNFIFNRNKTLCENEPFKLLKSSDSQIIFNNSKDLHLYLDQLLTEQSFDLILTYSSPIIKNEKILDMLSFNLHLGLSRFYRGGISNVLALSLNEFNKAGSTCHELTAKIDDGKALFEIRDLKFENFKNIDQMNYYIIKRSVGKLIEKLNKEDFNTYTIPKGSLVLNRSLTAKTIIEAEKNIKNKFES
tara:strand:- start:10305 stop:11051 length:747 start_codon:yes stop_codon:yes gene_type:complete